MLSKKTERLQHGRRDACDTYRRRPACPMRLHTFAVSALLTLSSLGADVTMSINPPLISMGEAAQIKVEVRGTKKAQAPNFPKVDGLTFSGTGQSSQTSIANGKVDKLVAYTVNAYPQKTGEFLIGPFEYKVDGETKTLQGKLKVVATSGDAAQPQSWSELVFAKLTSNRDKAYVQEPFELTLSVYSRSGVQLAGNMDLQGMPETGLSDLEWKEAGQSREQIDGQIYDVRKFRATARTMGSGKYEFAPRVVVQVAIPNQQRRRDPFGFDSFFNRTQTRPVELTPEPVTVSVIPLPNIGKSANFSGAVGRFQFGVTAEPKEVSPGDPITLQMTIIGGGNFDRIQPPTLSEDDSFRLFGDAVRQQGNNGVRFEQVISPRSADVTEIPSISFSFFDTEAGAYRMATSRPIPITVTASSNEAAQVFVAKDTLVVAPVDQPFATESDVQRFLSWLNRGWQAVRPWLWILPAALGVGLLLFFGQKLYHWRRKDVAWVRRQKAPKAAQQALRKATLSRKQGDASAFYNALGCALTDYFGNRLNLPQGDASAAVIMQALQDRSVPGTLLESVQALFEQIDAARYSPPATSFDIETAGQQQAGLYRLLKQLEKVL